MPISVQCPQCHRAYRLDDKLAGQLVRCRDCGAGVQVPKSAAERPLEIEPEVAPVGNGGSDGPSVTDLRSLFGAAIPERQGPPQPEMDLREASSKFKKRRWVRTPGSPMLESIDELLKGVGVLCILGGITVWIVHVAKSPTGLSVASLLPLGVVLVVLAGVMAPIASLSINAAVRIMKLALREDTYTRVAIPFLLPFAASMLAASPGMEGRLEGLTVLAWFLAPAMLLYFFRAEVIEWSISIAALAIAMGLGLIAASIASSIEASFMGPLYADMLPAGPWTSLAKGHSPAPPEIPAPPLAVATRETQPAAAAAVPVGPVAVTPAPLPAPVAPAPSAVVPPEQVAINTPTATDPPGTPKPAPLPVKRVAVSRNLMSPFLTDTFPAEAGFTAVTSVIAPAPPMGSMLIVRNGENEATVEKWDLAPSPQRKSKTTFPLFAKKPHVYDLSPKGDILVALCFFPRSQIDITNFDGKTARKIVPLDIPDASPSLLGFVDVSHFFVRWEATTPTAATGNVRLQQWNALSGQPSRLTAPMSVAAGANSMLLSPTGHLVATFERDLQLAIYNLDSGQLVRRMRPSDLGFALRGMAFSPDSTQIALYGVVADVPTILSFKTQTGAPLATAVLPAPAGPANKTPPSGAAPMGHPLLWIQTGGTDAWLVNGNELFDPTTGRKFGTLGLPPLLDQQLVSSNTLVFQLPTDSEETMNLVTARIDDAKLHDAAEKAK